MRIKALTLLNHFDTKVVDKIFIRISKNGEDDHLRKLAIQLMAIRRRKRIESALLKLLKDDDFVIRALAIESLSNFASKRVVRRLLNVALYDEITMLQFSALNVAMAQIHLIDFVDPLIRIVKSPSCVEVRDLANGYLLSQKISIEDGVCWKNLLDENNSVFEQILASAS